MCLGSHFRDTVQTHEPAPFAGWFVAQLFEAGHPGEGQRGEQDENGLERIEALGQGEIVAGVAQQAEGEQRGQGAEDAAVGDVIGGFEAKTGGVEQAEGGGETIHFTGGGHAENGLAIGLAALALRTGYGWRGRDLGGRESPVRVTGYGLFLSVRGRWLCGWCWAAPRVLCRWRARCDLRQGALAPRR